MYSTPALITQRSQHLGHHVSYQLDSDSDEGGNDFYDEDEEEFTDYYTRSIKVQEAKKDV